MAGWSAALIELIKKPSKECNKVVRLDGGGHARGDIGYAGIGAPLPFIFTVLPGR